MVKLCYILRLAKDPFRLRACTSPRHQAVKMSSRPERSFFLSFSFISSVIIAINYVSTYEVIERVRSMVHLGTEPSFNN